MNVVLRYLLSGWILGSLATFGWSLEYRVEPCCRPCPQLGDPASYDTSFLKMFRTLVSGQDDWLFRSDVELATQFGPDGQGYADFGRLVQAFARHDVQLALIYQPTRGLMHADKLNPTDKQRFAYDVAAGNYAQALAQFRARGAIVPDFTALFGETADPNKDFFFRRDHHWTPYGAETAAKVVADAVKSTTLYRQLPKQEFSTRRSGLIGKRGTLQMAFSRMCGVEFADQYVDEYTTEPTASSSDAGGLFGDDALPEVTLVGTSNSRSAVQLNFDGFLKQYLQTDILNVAKAGAGLDGAMLEYLPSDEFQQSPPKLLLWEVPSYYSLQDEMFYREAIPLIDNGCVGKPTEFSAQKKTLQPGSTEILFNGGGQFRELSSAGLVADIQFSDPNIRELVANVWYINGRKERVHLERPAKVSTQGRFLFELKSDPQWRHFKFLSLEVEMPPDYHGSMTVSAQLCRKNAANQGGMS
ncbi:alginate O-acetyltransferase AlgX-related protein [Gynuella sp.]|uniref:alginate O-acetyltransferase AlgX-related protein n=1 Tax=Gynuella sp. TaxID=2969146 RepID=UPI003D0A9747